ncbi:gamma-glutamyl-gamma-aminobutyrate hydrolase family protein [candidate division TA06 bacterium]|nr:gamma-glutamyl-gamma-aminobutyrate hydrolase family protein [candidate division TA06 bacterium]
MKILLINCYTKDREKKVKSYLSLLQRFGNVEIVGDEEIQKDFDLRPFDAVVITGSGKDITKGEYREVFLNFLRNSEKPLLGICYGHQVLAHSFGCKVEIGEQMTKPYNKNPHWIQITEEDHLFSKMGSAIQVDEDHHEYVILEGPEKGPFNLLATSEFCPVEAIQHKDRPIYGVQFHPERSGEVGRKIIENFFERVVKNSSSGRKRQ